MASDDIVARLRAGLAREWDEQVGRWREYPIVLTREAADEIERLSTALAQAESALLAADAQIAALTADGEAARGLLAKAYTVMAFAFNRIHALPKSRDTELAHDIGKVRAEIEAWQRRSATPSPTADKLMAAPDTPTWPAGCRHPNSCARNGRCGYIGCAHQARDIAQDIRASLDGAPS